MKIKVIPNAKEDKLVGDTLYLKAVPEKDKANKALIKFFKKNLHLNVRIKSGEKSRNKVIEII